jgi:hypothetical protein
MALETRPERSPSARVDPPLGPRRRPLRAGPLTLEIEPETAIVRSVAFEDEIGVHAVYGAVRDAAWNVVPGEVRDWSLEFEADAFRASFRFVHRAAEVHFAGRGRIEGRGDGVVHYDFAGEALSSFWRRRIGLCVLWPLRTARTRWVWRQDRTGGWSQGCLPRWIDPSMEGEPGWSGLRALAWPVGHDRWLESAWEGELFELEDQRNWTDASFKAYGTPLSEPSPVFLSAGTMVRQRATLRLRCSAAFPTAPGARVRDPMEQAEHAEADRLADWREGQRLRLLSSEELQPLRNRCVPLGAGRTLYAATTIRVLGLPEPETERRPPCPSDYVQLRAEVGPGPTWPLPKLGVELGQPLDALAGEALTHLRGLDLAHIRWHLDLTRPDWPERYAAAAAKVQALGTDLELFLTWPAEAGLDGAALHRAV